MPYLMDMVVVISETPEEFVTWAFLGEIFKNNVDHALSDGLTTGQMGVPTPHRPSLKVKGPSLKAKGML